MTHQCVFHRLDRCPRDPMPCGHSIPHHPAGICEDPCPFSGHELPSCIPIGSILVTHELEIIPNTWNLDYLNTRPIAYTPIPDFTIAIIEETPL